MHRIMTIWISATLTIWIYRCDIHMWNILTISVLWNYAQQSQVKAICCIKLIGYQDNKCKRDWHYIFSETYSMNIIWPRTCSFIHDNLMFGLK